MLNFLSRIDRYMASNMREHGRYLLELQPIDDKAPPERAPQRGGAIERARGAGRTPRKQVATEQT